jgi:pilus assembly protein TadC
MPEPTFFIGALVAGLLFASAALLVRGAGPTLPIAELQAPVRRRMAGGRAWLAVLIDRAGWPESPERVATLTLVLAAILAALGLSSAIVVEPSTAATLGALGAAAGAGAVAFALRSAIARRRARLSRQLAPLLELFLLELGGGGSAFSALGSVTMQLEGELAAEMRRRLIASQVAGSASFESRLRAYADRMQIPALASLATILAASREYGTGVAHGVRALAASLRRAQRRELIAHSRRALNHVLFPAAIGVLLPFLAILLFPAVTALQRNLR